MITNAPPAHKSDDRSGAAAPRPPPAARPSAPRARRRPVPGAGPDGRRPSPTGPRGRVPPARSLAHPPRGAAAVERGRAGRRGGPRSTTSDGLDPPTRPGSGRSRPPSIAPASRIEGSRPPPPDPRRPRGSARARRSDPARPFGPIASTVMRASASPPAKSITSRWPTGSPRPMGVTGGSPASPGPAAVDRLRPAGAVVRGGVDRPPPTPRVGRPAIGAGDAARRVGSRWSAPRFVGPRGRSTVDGIARIDAGCASIPVEHEPGDAEGAIAVIGAMPARPAPSHRLTSSTARRRARSSAATPVGAMRRRGSGGSDRARDEVAAAVGRGDRRRSDPTSGTGPSRAHIAPATPAAGRGWSTLGESRTRKMTRTSFVP